jgi:hypothetical protein
MQLEAQKYYIPLFRLQVYARAVKQGVLVETCNPKSGLRALNVHVSQAWRGLSQLR